MDINLKILRYNPETDKKGHWEEYSLDADPCLLYTSDAADE